MWFLAEGRLQSVHLTVPRTLYIDYDDAGRASALEGASAAPGQQAGVAVALAGGGVAVSKVLPGGLKPQLVMQVWMDGWKVWGSQCGCRGVWGGEGRRWFSGDSHRLRDGAEGW